MFATGTRPNLSPAVSVIAVEPPPIAVITSPVTGSTVSGAVTVAAIGSVDPRVTDQPKSMQLVVDGTPYGRATTCPIGTTLLHDCAASLPWFTGSLYGPHSIQVRLQTARTSVLSASTTLFVAARQAKLTVAEIHYAGVDYIKGTVTGPGFLGISGATVTVTVTPAGGAPRTLTITSGPGGTFVAPSPIKPTVNTRLEASVGPELGSATATDFVGVNAKLACSVPASIRHGVAATVTCKTPGLPDGTVATLWYSGKTGVHAAAHAKAKNGKVTLTLTIAKKWQRIRAWVVTAGNKKYVTSQTRAFKVHVL
jgi:hypothetical protein